MRRTSGRVTRDDIRSAGLRRWNGRARITTEWINVFHEPELCWPTGDCLVYLREPGQSSRGPAFRIHTDCLKVRGFDSLVDRCVVRNSIHAGAQCVLPNCPGCDPQQSLQELYIPAPYDIGLEETFNHHITTRNFFAWLYNRPLAGRTLGKALVGVKRRMDVYRPDHSSQNTLEVVSYAESQRYLDFRECVDHALSALYMAEELEIEDLWVDAFSHCVGLSHRGLRSSVEYAMISPKSKALISRAKLELDDRLSRTNESVVNFFDDKVSDSFLGLPQPARAHLERFCAFLREIYVGRYGCWPPPNFEEESIQQAVYAEMLADFQNLYQHLVDPESSTTMEGTDISKTGGVCTIQNIQVFDFKHNYKPLAQPLPLMPTTLEPGTIRRTKSQRRLSWNPIQKRKADKDAHKMREKQALMTASNRDLLIMDCDLVRKFSEFEEQSVDSDLEGLPLAEGRKIRWMLVYAILQVFRSVSHPPKQVRNVTGLTYSLCCRPPKRMPWQESRVPRIRTGVRSSSQLQLVPDQRYSHTNASTCSMGEQVARGRSLKARRLTLPDKLPGALTASLSTKTPPGSRASSLKRLMSRRTRVAAEPLPTKRPSFCEIYIQGYGNGLNEVKREVMAAPAAELTAEPEASEESTRGEPPSPQERIGHEVHELDASGDERLTCVPSSDEAALTTPEMSRESSTTSTSSHWSKKSGNSDLDPTTPASDAVCTLQDILRRSHIDRSEDRTPIEKGATPQTPGSASILTIVDHNDHADDDDDALTMPSVHFNTLTWDRILAEQLVPVTASTANAITIRA
ncbi:hypothetical protein H2202_003756 [Exophiala xenobiotica]|nr:hypothetical protein H2202_003756 [Exophiala xenobiotica]KAK5197061.1 hypothetical protein LTR92_002999 [Exophiala xenobiotica]KAK5255009.1 hypothetical protein LTS06_000793 [Exophiala xenobiotica]KAK5385396.1 hypothetical protein LTR11_001769 [Exophiala xenobiotica]KAK5448533.1 hypothetical protein LTR18_001621 [Exophiala xenobiotica]